MFSRFSANGVQSGSLLAPQFPVSNHYGFANLGLALCHGERSFYMHYDKRYSTIVVTFYPDIWPLCCFNDSFMLKIY